MHGVWLVVACWLFGSRVVCVCCEIVSCLVVDHEVIVDCTWCMSVCLCIDWVLCECCIVGVHCVLRVVCVVCAFGCWLIVRVWCVVWLSVLVA